MISLIQMERGGEQMKDDKAERLRDVPLTSLTGVGVPVRLVSASASPWISLAPDSCKNRYDMRGIYCEGCSEQQTGLWKRGTWGLCRKHDLLKLNSCQDILLPHSVISALGSLESFPPFQSYTPRFYHLCLQETR